MLFYAWRATTKYRMTAITIITVLKKSTHFELAKHYFSVPTQKINSITSFKKMSSFADTNELI